DTGAQWLRLPYLRGVMRAGCSAGSRRRRRCAQFRAQPPGL
ncbi:MAG: hypothetical protein AVDCRST_MAG71-2807, partial [uncultured Lysobacter sp.]